MNEDIPVFECAKAGQCDFAPVTPPDKLAPYELQCAKCGRTIEVEARDDPEAT